MAPADKEASHVDERTPLSQEEEDIAQAGPSRVVRKLENIDEDDSALFNFYMLVGITETIGIVCVVLVIIWMSHYRGGFAWDGSGKEFNYHPVFMVVGLVFLYGNAALVYRVFRKTEKIYTKLIHMSLQAVVMIMVVVGLVTVFDFHNAQKIPNMYSLHSWIGLSSVILFFLQFLFGFLAFLLPKFSDEYREKYLLIHQYFGSAIFILAVGACLLGTTEKLLFSIKATYSKFVIEGILANILGMVLVIFCGLVMLLLTKKEFRRRPDSIGYTAIQ